MTLREILHVIGVSQQCTVAYERMGGIESFIAGRPADILYAAKNEILNREIEGVVVKGDCIRIVLCEE